MLSEMNIDINSLKITRMLLSEADEGQNPEDEWEKTEAKRATTG